ncbi:TIGR03089 family protein [Citricoccus sp. NPDC055426]|uniref:TIGR03089 family protein n=1 Tax=Citricoccus sp. NPDC055426 TaxID=3155536 RepID=UPI00341EE22A
MVTLGTNLPGGSAGRSTGRTDWFAALAASPRPAVVDYAAGGQRVELSGRVLANWGAKTANLLEAEGHGPDATVLVDLPLDWMSLAALLGLARAGVAVVFAGPATETGGGTESLGGAGQHADLILTGTPGRWADHPADLWTVAPGSDPGSGSGSDPGSAEGAGTSLPAHAVDFVTEVRMQADQCHLPLPGGPEGLPALAEAWEDLTAREGAATTASRLSVRERGLVAAAAGARLDLAVARATARTWDLGQPVMLVPESTAPFSAATDRQVAAESLGASV